MENPFVLAALKFAILGAAGEFIAKLIAKKKIIALQSLHSALVWAALGVLIKFMFTGFHGFVEGLEAHGYLPGGLLWTAFFTSLFTNAMFGPWVIILHRLFDSTFYGKFEVSQNGLKGALLTLVWFWIPAHTVTFALPKDYQITLAAVWSFVLALILGIFNNMKKKK